MTAKTYKMSLQSFFFFNMGPLTRYNYQTLREGKEMAKKLYVGNLSYNITEDALKDVFTPLGEVQSVKIITDAATGRSKGFGFVEMTNDEDADKAIASLNGTNVMDRAINVSEARPQTERGGRGGRPGGGGGRGGQRGFDRGGDRGGRNKNSWR
jgi:RNA recognition motif-containing protein